MNLVSEHVWCDDFLVRSFYLKNMQTNETRTVTQFHYHTWLNDRTPETSQTLLDFRRCAYESVHVLFGCCASVCVCVSSWAVASVIFVVVQLVHWLQLHSHKSDH